MSAKFGRSSKSDYWLRNSLMWFHATVLVGLTSGCSLDGNIKFLGSKHNFLKTEIISNGPVPGDNNSQMTIAIHLKNSDGSVVPNYKPAYEFFSGSGVIGYECTTSLDNGLSYCLAKASQPGIKKLRLTNALVGLSKDILFTSVAPTGTGFVSGGGKQVTADGYKIEASIGSGAGGAITSATDGYTIHSSVQGATLERQ